MKNELQNKPPSALSAGAAAWRRAVGFGLLLVLALAASALAYRKWIAAGFAPADSGAAAWIWSVDEPRATLPRAFYLVKDFHLDAVPASAELSVIADKEYLLYLNGQRVGSNVYRSGASMDRYDVAPLLMAGGNRLMAEARTRTGAGGFLLRMLVAGREVVVSDGSWRAFRRYDRGLFGGWTAAADGEPVRVWGRPPAGRWRHADDGAFRPLFSLGSPSPPAVAQRGRPMPWWMLPEPFRGPLHGPGWPRIWNWDAEGESSAAGRVPGEPSGAGEGYVELHFQEGAPAAGVVFLNPAPLAGEAAEASDYLLAPSGAPSWSSATPRRARFAALVATRQPDAVHLLPAPVGLVAEPPEPPESGVLGIDPPLRSSPIEAEVLRLLKRPVSPTNG